MSMNNAEEQDALVRDAVRDITETRRLPMAERNLAVTPLDLRQATIPPGEEAIVDVFVVMGVVFIVCAIV